MHPFDALAERLGQISELISSCPPSLREELTRPDADGTRSIFLVDSRSFDTLALTVASFDWLPWGATLEEVWQLATVAWILEVLSSREPPDSPRKKEIDELRELVLTAADALNDGMVGI